MLEEELLRDQERFLDFERDQELPELVDDCELLLDLDPPFFPLPLPLLVHLSFFFASTLLFIVVEWAFAPSGTVAIFHPSFAVSLLPPGVPPAAAVKPLSWCFFLLSRCLSLVSRSKW